LAVEIAAGPWPLNVFAECAVRHAVFSLASPFFSSSFFFFFLTISFAFLLCFLFFLFRHKQLRHFIFASMCVFVVGGF